MGNVMTTNKASVKATSEAPAQPDASENAAVAGSEALSPGVQAMVLSANPSVAPERQTYASAEELARAILGLNGGRGMDPGNFYSRVHALCNEVLS